MITDHFDVTEKLLKATLSSNTTDGMLPFFLATSKIFPYAGLNKFTYILNELKITCFGAAIFL